MNDELDFIVLGKPDCHLCDQVIDMFKANCLEEGATLGYLDISKDKMLKDEYQLLVPVLLRMDDDEELLWPFDEEQLLAFVRHEEW